MTEKLITKTSHRIITIDILRGIMLLSILINHVELYPSIFDFATGRGRLWVSAAEGFFFLSGLLVALIYCRRMAKGMTMRSVFKNMWVRALELYVLSVALTLLFTYWAVSSHHIFIKYGLPPTIDWGRILVDTLTMRYSFGWADFLPHYAVFMFFAPIVFWLLTKGKWWIVVLASIALWSVRGLNFDLAWQTVFLLGMFAGFYWKYVGGWLEKLKTKKHQDTRRSIYFLTAITFLISYSSVYVLSLLNYYWDRLPFGWLQFTEYWNDANTLTWPFFDKWTMAPGRILMFLLWFTAAYLVVERYQDKIQKWSRGLFELLGRNSLFVYVAHAFLIFGLKFKIPPHTNLLSNFGFTLFALVVIIIATVINSRAQAWFKAKYGTKPSRHLLSKSRQLLKGA